jgi:hypothetical protein
MRPTSERREADRPQSRRGPDGADRPRRARPQQGGWGRLGLRCLNSRTDARRRSAASGRRASGPRGRGAGRAWDALAPRGAGRAQRQSSSAGWSRRSRPRASGQISAGRIPLDIHVKFSRKGLACSRAGGSWRKTWSREFSRRARSPPLPERRCWPHRARPRPPSPSRHPRSSQRSRPPALSPCIGATGAEDGAAGGIADGDGTAAGIADGHGMAAGIAGEGVRVIMASDRPGAAGGPRGVSAAADGSEGRNRRGSAARSGATPPFSPSARRKSRSSR